MTGANATKGVAMDIDRLKDSLELHEDKRTHPYDDETGKAPELYEHGEPTNGKVTIGIGWNLTANGLPDDIIDMLLDRRIEVAMEDCAVVIPHYAEMSVARQNAITEVAFALGRTKLSKFPKMLDALARKDYTEAAEELHDSRWARTVGKRAETLGRMLRTNRWPGDGDG